ncbi:MAG: cation diffusion facilitator family transporter, partial [Christensenellaceae bacterium]|nr:cation diffusion facilitator family transporter [Christensenellaceae bacterium]
FGHGRIEYIAALVVSFLILLVGFELLKGSVEKFFNPEPLSFEPIPMVLLTLSIGIKLWMFHYNKKLGALINSQVMRATAKDSLNDVFVTGAVVAATVASRWVTWPIDAVAGLMVSLLILYNGYDTARDTVGLLLGGQADPELMREIEQMVLSSEGVIGVHDLIVHDYGPGRAMASVHAEVRADGDILRIHEAIDDAEQRIFRTLGVPTVIHMDPIVVDDERIDGLREQVRAVLAMVNPTFSFHDFRMTDGENRVNLIFDLAVPCDMKIEERTRAVKEIGERLREIDGRYRAVMQIDDDYRC